MLQRPVIIRRVSNGYEVGCYDARSGVQQAWLGSALTPRMVPGHPCSDKRMVVPA